LQQLHWRFGGVENFGLVVEETVYLGAWCGGLRDCRLDSAEVSKPTVPTSGIHKEYGWVGFDTARLGCHVGTQSISCIQLKPGIYTRKQMDSWAALKT
jgi:hypothetical protein